MFPLKDQIQLRGRVILTPLFILLNLYVFYLELSASNLTGLIERFALTPANFALVEPISWYPLVTSQFLHAGWFHLIANLWFLFVFGPNIEKAWGPVKFLFFYLTAGVVGAFLQMIFTVDPTIPMLGASGAIAGLLGAYFVYFPRHRIVTLVPLGFIPLFIAVPAGLILLYWFGLQVLSGFLDPMLSGGVAFFAHIGGFITGVLLAVSSRTRKTALPNMDFR